MKTFKSILLLFLLVVLLFSAVYGFTSHSFIDGFDLRSTGQIGDTIGGITGPIINLLGAILVYLSFRQQQEANRIQTEALTDERKRSNDSDKYNQLVTLIDDLEKNIQLFQINLTHSVIGKQSGQQAFDALTKFISAYKHDQFVLDYNIKNPDEIIQWYINFLKFCLYTIDSINGYTFIDPLTKELLTVKFISMFSILDSHISKMNHETNGVAKKDLIPIYDYTFKIHQQVYAMKNSTSHFKY